MSFLVCVLFLLLFSAEHLLKYSDCCKADKRADVKKFSGDFKRAVTHKNNRSIVANLSTRPLFRVSGCKCENEPRAAGTGQPVDIRKLLTLVFNVTKGKF